LLETPEVFEKSGRPREKSLPVFNRNTAGGSGAMSKKQKGNDAILNEY